MTAKYPKYVPADSQWLDTVPAHWRVGRLDHVARAWPSNVDKHSAADEPPVRLCNYTDVYKNASIVEDMSFMAATASSEQIERFRIAIGDTLLTKDSETADDIGVPAYVEFEAPDLICGYHLSIVRPIPGAVEPKFLYWTLGAGPTTGQWAVLASGVTRVGIKAGDLAKAALAFPPLDEQRAISDYLDRETARIDTLIEEQQRLIETLRERRTAVIAHATLRGTDVELRRVIAVLRQGWSPNCESWPADGVSEWGVLKVGCANSGRFDPAQNKRLPGDETPRPELTVRKGEIVMSRSNTKDLVGAAAVVDGEYPRLILSDLTYGLSLSDEADPAFVAYALGTPGVRAQISAASKGMSHSMQKISQRDIRELRVLLPSLDEQRRIVTYLDEQTEKIDTTIAETERFIELSRERRSALITAAVTGQIDVQEMV